MLMQQRSKNSAMAGEKGKHGLDYLFQAHLPEFLQVLSAGLRSVSPYLTLVTPAAIATLSRDTPASQPYVAGCMDVASLEQA
jgi:hypothetical protein